MKVLIVDDQSMSRKGMIKMIDWDKLNLSLAGECANGQEALNFLHLSEQIDILLTDIRMPLLDGLQLAEKAKAYNKDLSVICFSGYDDFQYVRKSLQLSVEDYLLKPVDPIELNKALEQTIRNKHQQLQEQLKSIQIVRNEFLPSKLHDKEIRKSIYAVTEYIKDHFNENISLTELSRKYYLSPGYFSSLFRDTTGVNFLEYLTKIRIEHAKHLILTSTHLRIYEIASLCGYQDVKYFRKLFKNYTTMTPQEFKENEQ